MPRTIFVPDPSGTPMVKIRPKVIPPGGKGPVDVFTSEEDRWFATQPQGVPRVFRTAGFVMRGADGRDLRLRLRRWALESTRNIPAIMSKASVTTASCRIDRFGITRPPILLTPDLSISSAAAAIIRAESEN